MGPKEIRKENGHSESSGVGALKVNGESGVEVGVMKIDGQGYLQKLRGQLSPQLRFTGNYLK
jgi:hypothetical protein